MSLPQPLSKPQAVQGKDQKKSSFPKNPQAAAASNSKPGKAPTKKGPNPQQRRSQPPKREQHRNPGNSSRNQPNKELLLARKQFNTKLNHSQLPECLNGFGGVRSGNEKEVVFRTIEYFDHTPTDNNVRCHLMSLQQSYLGRPTGLGAGDNQLTRPRRGRLFAMPKFSNADMTNQVFTVLSGVRMSNSAHLTTAGQHNATVIPEASPRWIEVGSWNYDELFDQNWFRPVLVQNEGTHEELFEAFAMSIIDPDTATAFKSEVQFRFEYEFAQTLAVENLVREAVADVADWTTYPTGQISTAFAIVQPLRLSNTT